MTRVALAVLALVSLALPAVAGPAVKGCDFCLAVSNATLLAPGSGDHDPVLADGGWTSKDFTANMDGGGFAGNFTHPDGGLVVLSGSYDRATGLLTGTYSGNEAFRWDDGKGYRTTAFGASFSATFNDVTRYKSVYGGGFTSRDPVFERVKWTLNSKLTFSRFDYAPGSVPKHPGGLTTGRAYDGGATLRVEGNLSRGSPPIQARIVALSGDVEWQQGAHGAFVPASVGQMVREGDSVSTGYDSSAKLDFGYATLQVGRLTQFRLDQFASDANIAKTQVFLRVGAVEAKITNHTESIRSDFSVVTPTVSSSIRGSAMVVAFNETTRTTDVYATEGQTFVKGTADSTELTLRTSQRVGIPSTGVASAPAPFVGADLPAGVQDAQTPPAAPARPGMIPFPTLALVIVVLAAAAASARKR